MTSLDAPLLLEQARRLVADGTTPAPADLTAEHGLALGWALKGLCYAAWSSEPQGAVRAAAALRRLRHAASATGVPAALAELDALVAWTDGIAHAIQGEMETTITRLDLAASTFASLHMPQHAAQTQVPKIMALAMLGRDQDAVQCAETTLHALLESGDTGSASKVLVNLGNLHLRADRYAAAAARLREASELFERIGDAEHAVMAQLGLGDALTALGQLDDAQRIYAHAHANAASHAFPVLEVLAEESRALLDLACGRYREALAGLEGARRRYAALEMPQHLAIAEKQLADAYLELRLLPEALAGHAAALGRFEALDMQVDRAWTLVQRGRALVLAGHREAAASALAEAEALFIAQDSTVGAAAVALAEAELALSGAHDAQDAQGGQALALAMTAARGYQRAGVVERQLRAEAVQAQALLQRGEVAAARARFDATLDAAQRLCLLPVQLRCLTGRAITARLAGEHDAARADLEAAAELFEDQCRNLPGDELRSAFQNDHLLPFEELLRLALQAHDDGQADAADVLAPLDRYRARALADRLDAAGGADADADHSGDAGTPARQEMQALRTRLAWLYRRLHRLGDEATASSTVTAELRATERALLERTRRARLANATAAAPTRHAGLDTAALQQALGPDDAFVEYGVQDDELFACVVTRTGVHVRRRMASWALVLEAVRAVRFQVETLRHGVAPMQRHLATLQVRLQRHLEHLHAMVWQPLQSLLAGCTRVLVVPQAPLGSIPFAALHDGSTCMAERLQIAFAPSARAALHVLTACPRATATVLALGVSARLPHAAREANTISGLLPQGQAYVGAEATLANLHAHAGSASVIHLACHAQFRTDNPVFSALHLHDGVLTAEAIAALRLPGASIVLSGCETALGAADSGNEMFGLTRAFLVAGASRVLAALWPVDDATTAELMIDFYAGLRRGQPPGAALRHAQLAARKRQPHPFYWASFALTGRW